MWKKCPGVGGETHPVKCPAVSEKTRDQPFPSLRYGMLCRSWHKLRSGRQAENWHHRKTREMCLFLLDQTTVQFRRQLPWFTREPTGSRTMREINSLIQSRTKTNLVSSQHHSESYSKTYQTWKRLNKSVTLTLMATNWCRWHHRERQPQQQFRRESRDWKIINIRCEVPNQRWACPPCGMHLVPPWHHRVN